MQSGTHTLVYRKYLCSKNMPEDSICPLPTSLLQTTQTATTRVSYVRGYREKKNKPKPNQPTLQSSNADGVTHTATQFFPQIFLLRNATESSVPLPESLTIDCFSLAFLSFHLHSELLLYNASNSSKKDGAVSIQSQLPAVYITAMQTEKIWILSGWKKKKNPTYVLPEQKETITTTSFPPIFSITT